MQKKIIQSFLVLVLTIGGFNLVYLFGNVHAIFASSDPVSNPISNPISDPIKPPHKHKHHHKNHHHKHHMHHKKPGKVQQWINKHHHSKHHPKHQRKHSQWMQKTFSYVFHGANSQRNHR